MNTDKTRTKKGPSSASLADAARSYFMPYQLEGITDDHRLVIWEKSIRIGATFCMSYRAVRRRVLGKGDCLVTSVSLPAAKEFIEQCKRFNEIFKIAASDIEAVSWGKELNEQGFCITYPNGCRIFAFSSNPKAVRSFGGEVMVDEIAFHQDPKEMVKSAGGRAMWGHPVTIWSSHNGYESEFNRLVLQEKAKGAKAKWHVRTTTLVEAIAQGLVEKINETQGTHFTRDTFIADTVEMLGGQEAFDEECLCQPRKGGSSAIPWQHIEEAKKDYGILRFSVVGDDSATVESAAEALLAALKDFTQAALGYDVARTGHLAAVWVNSRVGERRTLIGLVTFKGAKFSTQKALLRALFSKDRKLVGAGDKTGLGMQVCEELEDEFGQARFIGCNFGSLKPDLGTRMQKIYEQGLQQIPRGGAMDDIAQDISGIRMQPLPSGRPQFYESSNPLNKDSHCDIAWANALALMADAEEIAQGYF